MKSFLVFAIIALVVIVVIGLIITGGSEPEEQAKMEQNESISKLAVEDVRLGDGGEAVAGDTVFVHYVGTFENGTKFDSSRDRGEPFSFILGAGQVIAGWDQGVTGMKVGGVRKLTIPPDFAYGEGGVPGAIPPNSTLFFEVELLEVKKQ